MANGRVITGFSKPYVAKYTAGTSGVTYSDGQVLARGVSVEISPDDMSDNKFYADNVEAENAGVVFQSGTATITVDGLKDTAKKLIYGLPTANTAGWINYGNDQSVPYIGFGCVVRYQEAGTVTYMPVVLPKIMFNPNGLSANTQEEEIDWQTQELAAQIYRDDTTNQNWRMDGTAQSSEADAEAAIKTFLSIS